MDVEVAPDAMPLRKGITVDTVVVGSGIAGLSTAYELSLQGQKVAVLDRGTIGKGMTARTTAHLTSSAMTPSTVSSRCAAKTSPRCSMRATAPP